MQNISKKLSVWATIVVVLLLIPLALTLTNPKAHLNGGHGGGWDWSVFDFVWAFVVLFGAAFAYEFISRKMTNAPYKFAVGIACVATLVMIWINGAVGLVGDRPINMFYMLVPLTGLIGASISRFKPHRLSVTLWVMALVQMLIPTAALIINPHDFSPGIPQVFGLNAFFAMLFIFSASLFRHSAPSTSLQTNVNNN